MSRDYFQEHQMRIGDADNSLSPAERWIYMLDIQEQLVAHMGREEFLRRLNSVLQGFYQRLVREFPQEHLGMISLALDLLSVRIILRIMHGQSGHDRGAK